MYREIIGELKTIIQNINSVQSVYDYEPRQKTAYPCVTITPVGHNEEYLSIGRTSREVNFMIRVYQNITTDDDDGQILIQDVVDDVIDELSKATNTTLNGKCAYTSLSKSVFSFVTAESPLYVAEITYTAMVLFNRQV